MEGRKIRLTAKEAGRGKHKTIQIDKRHKIFSCEYILRHSVNPTQQHRITTTSNQQSTKDIHVTAKIEMERPTKAQRAQKWG
jgi:hypothetical protein